MFNLNEQQLVSFREELHKLAGPNWHNIAGGVGSLTGAGAAIGGLAGAAGGAVQKYREARREGSGVGQSITHGLSGALGGAGKGALVGAGLGAVGGAAAGHLAPSAVSRLTGGTTPILSGAARFGQRQLHGLTGWTPREGIESIRGGAYEAKQRLAKARESLATASGDKAVGAARKEIEAAERGAAASQTLQDRGMTSLPGIARAMKQHGVVNTIKADLSNQWHGGGLGSKALMLGLPAASAVGALASSDKEDLSGAGKGERVGRAVGQLAGGTVGSAVPIVGQTLIGTPLSAAGQMIGRGVDRFRGRKPKGDMTIRPSVAGQFGSVQNFNPVESADQVLT